MTATAAQTTTATTSTEPFLANPRLSLVEFPDIGHADLLECPQDAIRIVSSFFRKHAR